MSFRVEDGLLLEDTLLWVPFENMRRTFKQVQIRVERDCDYVNKSLGRAATDSAVANDPTAALDEVEQRVRGLKRKLCALKEEQTANLDATKARVEFLKLLYHIKDVESSEYQYYCQQRLDMLIADYFLRCGVMDTAELFAKSRGVENLVNRSALVECAKIEKSLVDRQTTECVNWCNENKNSLKSVNTNLVFEIKLQCYIELVRKRDYREAILYFQKQLTKFSYLKWAELKRASALLAYPPSNGIPGPYEDLFSDNRWEQLRVLFVAAYHKVHGLPLHSQLEELLATGISALNTHSCRHGKTVKINQDLSRAYMCPVCSDELSELAESLPYAHHVKSQLDPDTMVLPNGRIYGEKKLLDFSKKTGVPEDKVIDPVTREVYPISALKPVYPS